MTVEGLAKLSVVLFSDIGLEHVGSWEIGPNAYRNREAISFSIY